MIDAGWSRDPLQLQAWTVPVVQHIIEAIPVAEIVVMASSFPDSFSHIVGNAEEMAHEDNLFESVQQQMQSADLTYGDWGSTRLSQSGGGGAIPPRIDVSRSSSWHIFRADPAGDEDYLDIASAVQNHPCFDSMPECWGKTQILQTDGEGAGITGTKMNTSARINAHMTLRAGATVTLDSDEQPYED